MVSCCHIICVVDEFVQMIVMMMMVVEFNSDGKQLCELTNNIVKKRHTFMASC